MKRMPWTWGLLLVLAVILSCAILYSCAYESGLKQGHKEGNVVTPPITCGAIPEGVPIWAVYIDHGRLFAVSACKIDDALMEFNAAGGPVPYIELDQPDAWFPLSADWGVLAENYVEGRPWL
jgi:hypothetical protein